MAIIFTLSTVRTVGTAATWNAWDLVIDGKSTIFFYKSQIMKKNSTLTSNQLMSAELNVETSQRKPNLRYVYLNNSQYEVVGINLPKVLDQKAYSLPLLMNPVGQREIFTHPQDTPASIGLKQDIVLNTLGFNYSIITELISQTLGSNVKFIQSKINQTETILGSCRARINIFKEFEVVYSKILVRQKHCKGSVDSILNRELGIGGKISSKSYLSVNFEFNAVNQSFSKCEIILHIPKNKNVNMTIDWAQTLIFDRYENVDNAIDESKYKINY